MSGVCQVLQKLNTADMPPPNDAAALIKAAKEGDAKSQHSLGRAYYRGNGIVAKNREEAVIEQAHSKTDRVPLIVRRHATIAIANQ